MPSVAGDGIVAHSKTIFVSNLVSVKVKFGPSFGVRNRESE